MRNEKKATNPIAKKIAKQVKEDLKTPTKNVAKAIKTRRQDLKLSRVSLYNISGVAGSTIGDIENAKYLPHFEVLLKLAYALGLSFKNVMELLTKMSDTKAIGIKENSLKIIKLALIDLNFTSIEADEIMEFIKFKGRKKVSLKDIT